MAKYLDSNGLHVVWARVKELVGNVIKVNVTDKLGKANGLATLGADGKLTGSQLPALKSVNGQSVVGSGDITIDLSLYKVVTALPATGDPSKIYLVAKSGATEGDVYTQHAWLNGKWVKLVEDKAAVDLSPYIKRNEAAAKFLDVSDGVYPNKNSVTIGTKTNPEDPLEDIDVNIPAATSAKAGVMSAEDKETLDAIPDQINRTASVLHYDDSNSNKLLLEYDELINGEKESKVITMNAANDECAGVMTAAMARKLNGIATSATSDSELTEAEILEVLK